MGERRCQTERGILVLRNAPGQWTEQFDHIPENAICSKFWELKPYSGCNFWCEYCYLWLTHRQTPFSTHYVNYDSMFRHLQKVDKTLSRTRIYNAGELSDPLAVEEITGLAEWIISKMTELKHSRLLLLTKSANVDSLLGLNHGGRTIMSFSLNTDQIWLRFEHRTPSLLARILAAKKAKEAGYEVRVRIDPVFYYWTWKRDYSALVASIFEHFTPDRITLGEYRPDQSLLGHVKPRFPDTCLEDIHAGLVKDAGKLRFPDPIRVNMLKHIKQEIRKHDKKVPIAICKEKEEIWKEVGLKPLTCNCN